MTISGVFPGFFWRRKASKIEEGIPAKAGGEAKAMGKMEMKDTYRPMMNLHLDVHKSKEEQQEWVRWCKKQGYGGFALIFGDSMKTDHLDESWYQGLFTATRNVAEEAKRQGLEVWIFDEWGYPSCVAGGLVGTEERLRSKKLHVAFDYLLNPGQTVSFQVPERLVSVKAIPVNRFGFYAPGGHCKEAFSEKVLKEAKPGALLTYQAGEKTERLVGVTYETVSFITHVAVEDNPENRALGTTDLLGRAAAEKFLQVVHERFYQALPEYFGSVIKGFFYDEPEICFDFPWTEGMEEEFLKRKGYDIREELPILMCYSKIFYHPGWDEGDTLIRKLTQDYFDVWTDLAAENFYGVLRDWCHERGIRSVGHQDMDNWTKTLASVSGHFFKNSWYNDDPGIDVINDDIEIGRFNDFPRFAGSAKRLMGKERALSETFALMGIGLSPDRQRFIMEHQVIRGVDQFFNMISYVGEEKGTPAPFTRGNPVGELHGYAVNTHVGRCAQVCNTGLPGGQTALYLPMSEIYLTMLRDGDPHNLNGNKPWICVDRIAKILAYAPCDFDYIWDEAILSLHAEGGAFTTEAGQKIRTIIIPEGCVLPEKTAEKLKEFCMEGGRVISVRRRIGNGCEEYFTLCPDYQYLKEMLDLPVTVKGQEGDARLSLCHRRDGGRSYFVLLNESDKDFVGDIGLGKETEIFEMDPLTGKIKDTGEAGALEHTFFAASQLRIFLTEEGVTGERAKKEEALAETEVTVGQIEAILPGGRSVQMDADQLKTWEDMGEPTYSGFVEYRIPFVSRGGRLSVSLGRVLHSAVWSLDVPVDPCEGGNRLSFAPFTFIIEENLEPGSHVLYVYVQNTPANPYLGSLKAEQETKDRGQINADRKMVYSGLLGPVRLKGEL